MNPRSVSNTALLPLTASGDRLTPQLLHAEVRYDRLQLRHHHALVSSAVRRRQQAVVPPGGRAVEGRVETRGARKGRSSHAWSVRATRMDGGSEREGREILPFSCPKVEW